MLMQIEQGTELIWQVNNMLLLKAFNGLIDY